MMPIKTGKLTRAALPLFLALLAWGINPALADTFGVELWPNGSIPYKFDTGSNDGTYYTLPFSETDKGKVELQMQAWMNVLGIADPSGDGTRRYIRFWECDARHGEGVRCPPTGYVLVRYNKIRLSDNTPYETNNMCTYFDGKEKVGRNPKVGGRTEYHLTQRRDATTGTYGSTQQEPRIILHELGHCLGIWHEFNRSDADRWLRETPELDGDNFVEAFGAKADLLPALGNYDYDSIVSYGSYADLPPATAFYDYWHNVIDKNKQGPVVSERDKSRVLQYYAHERYSGWGFFRSLSLESRDDPDELPNPYLAQGGIEAVGTPSIAYQGPGNYDIFARGSDGRLYWKAFRTVNNHPRPPSDWQSIGCCFSSDPSAVSRSPDSIDVVAVSSNGEVQRIKYINGTWDAPLTLRGGHPTGGIKQGKDGQYIGPAIASRGPNLLDVFVVRSDDGRLAVSTWSAGNWGAWRTLGTGYNVTARPAAVALSATLVQLAINENNVNFYEPWVTFPPLFPNFSLGTMKAVTAERAPPALAKRNDQISLYRTLITNVDGRISHRIEGGNWLDIGGIPKPGTGPSAVATGDFRFKAVMHGEDATGCDLSCATDDLNTKDVNEAPNPGGAVIQRGILWIRHFD